VQLLLLAGPLLLLVLLVLLLLLCVAKHPNCLHQMTAVLELQCPIHSSLLLYCQMALLLG
jgi:hypothetical protein